MTIRIAIADDHLIIRQGLRMILETESEFELVGEAGNGDEALLVCEQFTPDVILMDLRMPGMDGLTAIEELSRRNCPAAVVVLTTFNEDELMVRALQAGAKGYLLKDTSRETLFQTIHSAARGETLLAPKILERLFQQIGKSNETATKTTLLTDRELEVLQAVARGERSKEVAVALGITERTVKAHLASIYSKLGVDSRAAAIAIAAQKGWLDDPENQSLPV